MKTYKGIRQRCDKKWLRFKNQKLGTAIISNGVKNKDNKVFLNCTINNITGAQVVENQSKRKRPMEDKVQREKIYTEILKTGRDKADKL